MPDEEKLDFTLFLSEYLNEARDGFQRANDALLALEKDRGRLDLLDQVSRVFHTLKSSSALIGFADISDLAHSSEDLLGRMKRGETPVTQEAIDLLFEIIDTLEKMVRERGEGKEISQKLGVRSEELKKRVETLHATSLQQPPVETPRRGVSTLPTIEKI